MAKRLKTRLSAGAALVTGIGMMGIATAAPANAEVTGSLEYTCAVPDLGIEFEDTWTVDLTLPIEDQVERGATIPAGEISANVSPGSDAQQRLDDLDVTSLDGEANTSYTFGAEGEERSVDLTVPQTDVPEDGAVTVPATGQSSEEAAPDEDTTVDIIAGDFTATLNNQDDPPFVFNIECTAPDDATFGTVTVGEGSGEEPEEPTENDWFNEPSSLPLADNVFTVEGTATKAGTLSIEVLGESTDDAGEAVPGEVLETHTWEVTEGSNTKDFDLNEGAGYVRIVSQDCVDANGDDETVEGSGCNVLYTASWVDGGDNGDGEPVDDGAGEDGSDDTAGEPEVPEVVQTDGVQPATTATTPVEDNTLALTLGGLLLAGAGAGTVLVARRRAASQL